MLSQVCGKADYFRGKIISYRENAVNDDINEFEIGRLVIVGG